MPVTGSSSENDDKTKNYRINASAGNGDRSVNAGLFVSGQRDAPDPRKMNAPDYKVAGGSVGIENVSGTSIGLSGQHIPRVGNQVTASTNVNLHQSDKHKVDVNAFTTRNMPKGGPNSSTHGAGVNFHSQSGTSIGLSGQHTPKGGSQATASTTFNLHQSDRHNVNVNAFTTHNMPKAGPNFSTHGASVDYNIKNKLDANAAVSHTPMFKQTTYSAGANVNLHKTPTSSLDFSAGMQRTDTMFGRGNWQKQGHLQFRKEF